MAPRASRAGQASSPRDGRRGERRRGPRDREACPVIPSADHGPTLPGLQFFMTRYPSGPAHRWWPSPRGMTMQVVVERCAFLDVHRDTVMACARTRDGGDRTPRGGGRVPHHDLAVAGAVGLAGRARGDPGAHGSHRGSWKPVHLDSGGAIEAVWVVNARHMRNVPGRKTVGHRGQHHPPTASSRRRRSQGTLAPTGRRRPPPRRRLLRGSRCAARWSRRPQRPQRPPRGRS